jgi:GT2 family glycosyltransferase
MKTHPSVALVLETNNLGGGGASRDRGCQSLARLLAHLRGQSLPLDALAELVITHDGFEPAHQDQLEAAAGRRITLVRVDRAAGYYEAKNRGFEATRADVVVFGDSDCWPERAWLESLVAPFADDRDGGGGAVDVVAGRTTYRGDLLGIAATTIDFMYFPSPLGPDCTRNFYANNVAFRRQAFAAHRYADMDGVYRGHCQVLGLRLQARGVPIRFVPRARTVHRFPDTARELLRLRWLRGQDTVGLLPHLAAAYLPRRWRWLGRVGLSSLAVLAIRFGCSLRSIGRQDMPETRGLRALACAGVVSALSLADAAGALFRSLIGDRTNARADAQALSYHGDGDRLTGRSPV